MKRTIKVAGIVKDIRAGIPNAKLMEMYDLSRKQLYQVFAQLIEANVIERSELVEETPLTADLEHILVLPRESRTHPRIELDFELLIHEAKRPGLTGAIKDVSEIGVKIKGIEAKVGDVKTFSVPAGDFPQISPFAFEAVCRWVQRGTNGEYVSGYKISDISELSLKALRQLIRFLAKGKR